LSDPSQRHFRNSLVFFQKVLEKHVKSFGFFGAQDEQTPSDSV
jgi:hypothetical protein